MYNVEFLLDALDSFMESVQHKLSEPEFQLLVSIREHIAQNNNDKLTEESVIKLIEFILLIEEFIDKIT